MNQLKKFMIGRYGSDQLSIALIILSFLLAILFNLTNLSILAYISYIPLFIYIYRFFSKDIEKRRMENYKFSTLISPIYSWLKKAQYYIKKSKTHKRFICPNCKAKLWVPKGKGKIIITCSKCKTEFKERT